MFNLFRKKHAKDKELPFKDRFLHFQKMLEANDAAHKCMSDLADMIVSDRPFSRGYASKTFDSLVEMTQTMVEHFIALANGKHQILLTQLLEIEGICRKILSPRLFCPEGWDCPDSNCHVCHKVKIITYDIPYTYNIREIDDSFSLQVGSKMSRLAEIKNILKIPVPDGFCLSVRLFEELMNMGHLQERKNKIFYGVNFDSMSEVQRASRETQEMFVSNDIPEGLEEKILKAFDEAFQDEPETMVAVRSSAIGEDSAEYSFAGLHRSVMNVSRQNLVDACIEVMISKYSPQSLVYRYMSGLRDEDMPMSVGCIKMIDAFSAGVLFTSDPYKKKEGIIIQAVRGLGSTVVEGDSEPQEFIVSHSVEATVISFKSGRQEYKSTIRHGEGVVKEKINTEYVKDPCLTHEQITELVRYALRIEAHFGSPQDIEWAVDKNGNVIILQARPLITRVQEFTISDIDEYMKIIDEKYSSIINKGDCASHGIASGLAHVIHNQRDINDFPKDAIIVAKKNLPEFASLIHKAAGVITDSGSTTGHLSIIARELNIPVLTNTGNASELLRTGMHITLFADEKRVYHGHLPELTDIRKTQSSSTEKFRNSPMYRIWHNVIKFIFKLNLIEPNSANFRAESCQTIHDVIRYAHELALRYMFSVYESKNIQSDNTYELDIGIPLEIYVIDLGGGLMTSGTVNNKVSTGNILSSPFLALIEGMTTPGIRWSGHLSLDMRGFASLVFGNIVDVHRSETPLGSRNYALVSENYVNFFSRLGYHFSRLDAFASDEINRNYINFNFRGGAADHIRKMRRARAVQRILRHYNFSVTLSEDNVIASIRKIPQNEVFSLLKELGRLMGAVRNTDVTMLSDEHVDIFVQGFIEGDPAPALRYINNE